MTEMTLTLPLLPDRLEAWRRFYQTIHNTRHPEYIISRRQLGMVRETFELIETITGYGVIWMVTANDFGRVFQQMAEASTLFDMWFRQQMQANHGFVLTVSSQTA